ncbi:resolvase [Glutamicibacter ardleyensis]|uniref:Resolvase n=1 Tax=Glutamicibacter ardleyensis TaxID=225894 RepID=A0ABQ2DNM2_9MICC|nr:resolvase [Glutamicibacter ardleyensis]
MVTRWPRLEELIHFVRAGDTAVAHSMDRLARNLDDLRSLVQTLTGKGARVEFMKEGLVFMGEDSPMAKLMLSVMGRSPSSSDPRSGNANARASPWRKPAGSTRVADLRWDRRKLSNWSPRVTAGIPKAQLARDYGLSRATVYQYLRRSQATEKSGVDE